MKLINAKSVQEYVKIVEESPVPDVVKMRLEEDI